MRIFENVDFPDDFGPHRRAEKDFDLWEAASSVASSLFHCGGETRSWRMLFLGALS